MRHIPRSSLLSAFAAAFAFLFATTAFAQVPNPVYFTSLTDAVTGDNTRQTFTSGGVSCTNCYIPDANGVMIVDSYTDDLYERPTENGANASIYYPALDVVQGEAGLDENFVYYRITLYGLESNRLPYTYSFEMNFDSDNRGDILVRCLAPTTNVGTNWGSGGVDAWVDLNNNMGLDRPTFPDRPPGQVDGYEFTAFSQGVNYLSGAPGGTSAVQVRISPTNSRVIELAVSIPFLAALNGNVAPTLMSFRPYAEKGTVTNTTFYHHDGFPRKESGSPFPFLQLTGAPNACPSGQESGVTATQRAALDSGTHVNTGIPNPCYPSNMLTALDNAGTVSAFATRQELILTPDMSISKTHDGNFIVGSTGIYSIRVSNAANAGPNRSVITVTDTLPAGLTYASAAGTGWSCSNAGQVVTCTSSGVLLAGQSSSPILLTVNVLASAFPSVTNTASVSTNADNNSANNGTSDVTTVVKNANLSVVTTASSDPVEVGTNLTYTFAVSNAGPSAATGVTFATTLPASESFVSVSTTAGSCSESNGTITCTFASLASAAGATITVVTTPTFETSLSLSASISGNEADIDLTNNTSSLTVATTASTSVRPLAVLGVTSKGGQNTIHWRNPTSGAYTSTMVRFAFGAVPPATPLQGNLLTTALGSIGSTGSHTHSGLTNGSKYSYSVFVVANGIYSSVKQITATPRDTSGALKWIYQTNTASLTPHGLWPNATDGATYSAGGDGTLHALKTNATGGDWVSGYRPVTLGASVQSRTIVVNTSVIPGATRVVFAGASNGRVYAINALTGAQLWESPSLGDSVTASPSAMFTAFGGITDLVLVGTVTAGRSQFHGLRIADGSIAWTFDNLAGQNGDGLAMGAIRSGAVVDYTSYASNPSKRRVYFASEQGGSPHTLWALEFDATSVRRLWSTNAGSISGSPTLLNTAIYAGNNAGEIHAVDNTTGAALWATPYSTGDGAVRGFVWADRAASRLYVATSSKVSGLSTAGALLWSQSIAAPSALLVSSGRLVAGSGDGRLYQLATDTGAIMTSYTLGDGSAAVGNPTLDVVGGLIHVNTTGGSSYAVTFPLP